MAASLDTFTDGDLLVLCELADRIARKMTRSKAEHQFLAIMEAKDLWAFDVERGHMKRGARR